ncbi:hypothetical protein AAJ76_2000122171 [Vairimorpha ceranae]|nr:hypothetical protein AAJ76_2000122171 [Vairimorpha ceranae]KKO76573.1 hypothetical protein AAJ76_2000122171 [Vairimorpha ceranae]
MVACALPSYYIRLHDSNEMLARHDESVIASDFYSPIIIELKIMADGSISLIDKIKNLKISVEKDNIVLKKNAEDFETSLSLVYNGDSNFYIMKDDKCLEALSSILSLEITDLRFNECKKTKKQLWEILYLADRKIKNEAYFFPRHTKKHHYKSSHLNNKNGFFRSTVDNRLITKHGDKIKISEKYESVEF